MSLQHSPSIVTNGLSYYLDAANIKSYPGSGTTWNDLTGQNSPASLTVAPIFSANNGGSFVFNGSTTYVTLNLNSTILGLTNNFTNEIWYQTNNTQANLFYQRYPGGGYGIQSAGGTSWKATKYSVIDIFIGSVPQNTNWHQVVYVYSSINGVSVYIDGQLNANSNNVTNLSTSSTYATLGNAEAGFLNGSISSIKIYNRELNQQEIQQNFNALRGRYGL